MLIGVLQKLHLRFSIKKDNSGILCHHNKILLQVGHFDAGKTILSPANILFIITLQKLPIIKPKIDMHIS